MTALRADLRSALREIKAAPIPALAFLLVFSLGLAGALTIEVFAEPHLIPRLPYADASRLVVIQRERMGVSRAPSAGSQNMAMAQTLRRSALFSRVGSIGNIDLWHLKSAIGSRVLRTVEVNSDFLSTLGYRSVGADAWQFPANASGEIPIVLRMPAARALGLTSAAGQIVDVWTGPKLRVVDLLPESFVFPGADFALAVDALVPFASSDASARRAVGRLAPGVSASDAAGTLAGMVAKDAGYRLALQPLAEHMTARYFPVAAGGAVLAAFLLIASVTNLCLLATTRVRLRAPVYLVRSAIGASGRDLVRLTFVRHAVLAACAIGIALALSWVLIGSVGATMPREFTFGVAPGMTGRLAILSLVLGFGIGAILAIVDCVQLPLFGNRGIRAARQPVRRPSRLIRWTLVVAQSAVASAILTAASFLVRSHLALMSQDVGLSEDVVAFSVRPMQGRGVAEAREEIERTLSRLRALPGLERASVGVGSLYDATTATFAVEIGSARHEVSVKFVDPDYFQTTGIRIVAGRTFGDAEVDAVLVSESLARALWPDSTAVGQMLATIGGGAFHAETLGIAGDVMDYARDVRPRYTVYRHLRAPGTFAGLSPFHYVVRYDDGLSNDPGSDVRRLIEGESRGAVVTDVSTVAERLSTSVRDRTFVTFVTAMFGVVALGICLTGVASTVSSQIAERRREIGVRLSLGATMASIRRMVAGRTVTAALAGVAIGVVVSVWLSRFLTPFLFNVVPADVSITSCSAGAMLVTVLASSLWPTGRACGVDASILLREP